MTQVVKKFFICLVIIFATFFNSTAQVSFCAVGDVLLDRGVRKIIEQNNVFYPFDKIKNYTQLADIVFFNLECPIADTSEGFAMNKKFSFRADTSFIQGLNFAGLNIASLANNHTIDYGKKGLIKTIDFLNQNGICSVGAGKNQAEAFKPLLIRKNGETFAFFADLTFLLEGVTFTQNSPYPAFAQIDRLCDSVEKYNTIVDFVIVSFHWGIENAVYPTSQQIEFAHKVIDAGGDLVIGQHPHVLQPIEIYRNKIILYSLGNFVFDNSQPLEKQTAIFQCKFIDGQIVEPQLIPINIINNRPETTDETAAQQIFNQLCNISRIFGTKLKFIDKIFEIQYSFVKTIKELTYKNLHFNIFKDSIEVFDDQFSEICFKMPDTNHVFCTDACIYSQDSVVYIYAIVKDKTTDKLQIAIIPFSIEKMQFSKPYIDVHDYFKPWKLAIFDVDSDGNPELIVGVNKSTRYFKNVENRIFVFNRDKSYIYPKWLGSKIGFPIVDFKINDEDNCLDVLEQTADSNIRVVKSYKWNGFGFDCVAEKYSLTDTSEVRFEFLLQNIKFKQLN